IAQELALFGASVRGRYHAGWTREAYDRLPLCEQLWLDPERTELPLRDDPVHPTWQEDDLAFNQTYERGDWADEVATRFGLWLNGQLQKRGDKLVALGESAMRHFASEAILDVAWPIPQQRRAKAGAA
ncbi:MAG: type I-F CRISPR-associated protein Csy1, partial [Rhodanobacter sp.]